MLFDNIIEFMIKNIGSTRIVVEYTTRDGLKTEDCYECITISSLLDGEEFENIEDLDDEFNSLVNKFARKNKCVVQNIETVHDFKKRIVKEIRYEQAIQAAIQRLGNLDITYEIGYSDPDDNYPRRAVRTTTVEDILREIYNNNDLDLINDVKTISDLGNSLMDDLRDECLIFFGTSEEYTKHKAEKRRQELESAASQIAMHHNIKVNSLEFIGVVEKQIADVDYAQERWNDDEIRMEEWAAHMHSGSRDAYFDDLNFVNGHYEHNRDQLENILEWVSENCPLLWAQYEEQKLRHKNENNG